MRRSMFTFPGEVEHLLIKGARLMISISGGKDSQAMMSVLTRFMSGLHRNQMGAVHADLGRAEWGETPAEVERQADYYRLDLAIVRRPQGDLVKQIKDRMEKLEGTDRPFWPSSSARYCTSDQKRGQIDKLYRKFDLVISAEGIRAEESPARAKKPRLSIRTRITSKALRNLSIDDAINQWQPGQRLALTWYPIFDWTEEDVWQELNTDLRSLDIRRIYWKQWEETSNPIYWSLALDGWNSHPAYVYGNQRLSCALCILASKNDLQNGARHNPKLLETYISFEEQGGFTFKKGFSLKELDAWEDSPVQMELPCI